ncbi:hypothetical protein C9374_000331 [Naegleria lovaniensis]|uniref:Uncharacterized protein n=1 Tax=Naegleria lovaniensis TaxID=51637 RepID=A0AA88GXI3_NAELO|nr:uncharacterized protein C9374_000331 [Naegleria lovaniensis]KAG2388892.1 hypothetical protein C9374_000331 [Naegleria lovaniensis]
MSLLPSPPLLKNQSDFSQQLLQFARNSLLPSWLARSCTQLVIHPLYRAQIVLQTQACSRIPEDEKLNHFHEKFSAPTLIAVDDGFFSLWKTLVYNMMKSVPTIVVQYVLQKFVLSRVENENLKIALSAIASDILLYPLDLIEVVYMADRSEEGKFVGGQTFQFRGLFDCVLQMYQQAREELEMKSSSPSNFFSILSQAYYKGFLFRTLCVSTPTHLLNAYVENRIQQKGGLLKNHWRKVLTSGGTKAFYSELSETLSSPTDYFKQKLTFIIKSYWLKSIIYLLLYPLDTVSRKMQVNGQPGFLRKYTGLKDCFTTTFFEECSENIKDMTINNGFFNGYLFRSLAIPLSLIIPALVVKFVGNSSNAASSKKFSLLS